MLLQDGLEVKEIHQGGQFMIKGVSIFEKAKEHFEKIGQSVNDAQLRNVVTTVYTILQEKSLLIDIVIERLYPKSEFEEVYNDNSGKKEG